MKSEKSNFESFEKIPNGENWVKAENEKRNWMSKNSLYREDMEHASYGVGLVVSLDGKPNRKVVENGIDALKAIWHRGAVDADGKTGDGAGIHIQIPVPFFYDQIRRASSMSTAKSCPGPRAPFSLIVASSVGTIPTSEPAIKRPSPVTT